MADNIVTVDPKLVTVDPREVQPADRGGVITVDPSMVTVDPSEVQALPPLTGAPVDPKNPAGPRLPSADEAKLITQARAKQDVDAILFPRGKGALPKPPNPIQQQIDAQNAPMSMGDAITAESSPVVPDEAANAHPPLEKLVPDSWKGTHAEFTRGALEKAGKLISYKTGVMLPGIVAAQFVPGLNVAVDAALAGAAGAEAGGSIAEAAKHAKTGDYEQAAHALGAGSFDALMAALAIRSAARKGGPAEQFVDYLRSRGKAAAAAALTKASEFFKKGPDAEAPAASGEPEPPQSPGGGSGQAKPIERVVDSILDHLDAAGELQKTGTLSDATLGKIAKSQGIDLEKLTPEARENIRQELIGRLSRHSGKGQPDLNLLTPEERTAQDRLAEIRRKHRELNQRGGQGPSPTTQTAPAQKTNAPVQTATAEPPPRITVGEPPAAKNAETAAPAPAQLPTRLSGAKPRYNFGRKSFALDFASDLDKAALIAAQEKKSAKDDDYVKFVAAHTGLSEAEIRDRGGAVKSTIKDLARDAEPGTLTVPAHDHLWPSPADQDASDTGTVGGDVERYQWPSGRRMEIRPLDEEAFNKHAQPRAGGTFDEFRKQNPDVTHYVMSDVKRNGRFQFKGLGSLDDLRPDADDKAVQRVESWATPKFTARPEEVTPAEPPAAPASKPRRTPSPSDVEFTPVAEPPVLTSPVPKAEAKEPELPAEPDEPDSRFHLGRKTTVKTARDNKLQAQYAAIEAGDLITSHDTALNENPEFPQALQPRKRDKAASEQQINTILGTLDPLEVGENYHAAHGAPIIGRDRFVEAGNGRSIAIKKGYQTGHAKTKEYRDWLIENAENFGLDPEKVKAMRSPVLVRVRLGQAEDRPELARELNEERQQKYSESERARNDAARITPEMMRKFEPHDEGKIDHEGNREFLKDFAREVVPENEHNDFFLSGGAGLSAPGVRRVRSAIFAKAYGSNIGALEKMAEHTDSNIANVTHGMLIAAPRMADMEARVERGELHPLSIADDVTAAAAKLSHLKETGLKLKDYFAQQGMFGEELTPEAADLLRLFDKYGRSPRKIASILRNYADAVIAMGHPDQGSMFGPAVVGSKADALAAALKEAQAEWAEEARKNGKQPAKEQTLEDIRGGVQPARPQPGQSAQGGEDSAAPQAVQGSPEPSRTSGQSGQPRQEVKAPAPEPAPEAHEQKTEPAPAPQAPRPTARPSERPAEPGARTDHGDAGGGRDRRLAPAVKKIVTSSGELVPDIDTSNLPAGTDRLTPFQKQGAAAAIRAMSSGDGGFLLADGTGAGKTPQVCAVAKYWLERGKKVLLISQAEVFKFSSKGEVRGSYAHWIPALGLDYKQYKPGGRIEPGIVNLATFKGFQDAQIDQDTVLIFDEAHGLKNGDSAQAKAGMLASVRAHAVLFATATPADKVEHIPYLRRIGILEGKTLEQAFRDLGLVKRKVRFGRGEKEVWQVGPVGEAEALRRLNDLFTRMVERGTMLKREISLEGVETAVIPIQLSDKTKDTLALIEDELSDGAGLDRVSGLQKANILMHQRRQQEPDKIPHAVEIARNELANGRNVVIFVSRVNESTVRKKVKYTTVTGETEYYYQDITSSEGTAPALKAALIAEGVPAGQIAELHGGAEESGGEAMDRFQSGKARVMIATVESGGTGINLDDTTGERPRTLIVLTPPFSAVQAVQMAGRVWRMSTRSYPRIFYLFGDTDVDDWNRAIISEKLRTLGAVDQSNQTALLNPSQWRRETTAFADQGGVEAGPGPQAAPEQPEDAGSNNGPGTPEPELAPVSPPVVDISAREIGSSTEPAPAAPAEPKVGDTRVNARGVTETLERVRLAKIETAYLNGRENEIFPEHVQKYLDNPNHAPVELRTRDGRYVTFEGHHRIEAARRRGEKDILAWVAPQHPGEADLFRPIEPEPEPAPNQLVPAEPLRAPEPDKETREPWQMTLAEFRRAMREGRADFEGRGTDQKTGADYARALANAEGSDNEAIERERFERVTAERHRGAVAAAVAEGKPVPAGVLAEYPDLRPTSGAGPQTGPKAAPKGKIPMGVGPWNKLQIARLRKEADALQKHIDAKLNPAIAGQRPTARRLRIADSMRREGERLARVQKVLNTIADRMEAGTLGNKDPLTLIRKKTDAELLLRLGRMRDEDNRFGDFSRLYADDRAALEKMGVQDAAHYTEALDAVMAAAAGKSEDVQRASIRQRENQFHANNRQYDQFFPTPPDLAQRMVDLAGIEPGMSVLEPSAGTGRIADAILDKAGTHPDCVEAVGSMRELLRDKGHVVLDDTDFLKLTGEHGLYDRILMNPPFSKGRDVEHVHHAFSLLKPGGRLVAIVSEHPFFADDWPSQVFRAFFDEFGGASIDLDADTFRQSGTSVKTRLVVIDKPAEAAADEESGDDNLDELSEQERIDKQRADIDELYARREEAREHARAVDEATGKLPVEDVEERRERVYQAELEQTVLARKRYYAEDLRALTMGAADARHAANRAAKEIEARIHEIGQRFGLEYFERLRNESERIALEQIRAEQASPKDPAEDIAYWRGEVDRLKRLQQTMRPGEHSLGFKQFIAKQRQDYEVKLAAAERRLAGLEGPLPEMPTLPAPPAEPMREPVAKEPTPYRVQAAGPFELPGFKPKFAVTSNGELRWWRNGPVEMAARRDANGHWKTAPGALGLPQEKLEPVQSEIERRYQQAFGAMSLEDFVREGAKAIEKQNAESTAKAVTQELKFGKGKVFDAEKLEESPLFGGPRQGGLFSKRFGRRRVAEPGQPRETARVEYTPSRLGAGRARRPALLTVNKAGADLLDAFLHAIGEADEDTTIYGTSLGPELARRWAAELKRLVDARGWRGSGWRRNDFDALLSALRKVVLRREPAIIAGDPETLAHEKAHFGQALLGEDGTDIGHVDPADVLGTSEADAAVAGLKKNGYDASDPYEMVAEIGAHLEEGPSGWEVLGLSVEQAEVLRSRYVAALLKKHSPSEIYQNPGFRRILKPFHDDLSDDAIARANRGVNAAARTGARRGPPRRSELERGARPEREGPRLAPRFAQVQRQGAGQPGGRRGAGDARGGALEGEGEGRAHRPQAGESGFATPGFLTLGLDKFLDHILNGPRDDVSGQAAAKDRVVRNLSQLERVSEPAHHAAVRLATSSAQAARMTADAGHAIARTLKDAGGKITYQEFRQALMESRLRGVRERWQRFAQDVRGWTDKQLENALTRGNLVPLLEAVEGQHSIPANAAEAALAMAQTLQYPRLRRYLATIGSAAARATAKALDAPDYDRITTAPGFAEALAQYKDLVEKPLAAAHARNEGIFSNALGPLDTYYPLIAIREEEQPGGPRLAEATPYRKPRNWANEFATGLAKYYDSSADALRQRIERAIKGNNKAALIQALEQQGLLRRLKPRETAGLNMLVNGRETPAAAIEIGGGYNRVNGRLIYEPIRQAVVPKWLERELRPILARPDIRLSPARRLIDAITTYTLAGPMDFIFHSTNLVGTLVSNTPFLAGAIAPGRKGAALVRALSNLPFTKVFAAILELALTDPMDEQAMRDIRDMADLGLIPDRYGSETYSEEYADLTGAKRKRFSFGPLLYGPKGVDIRARLIMYRLAKRINPQATPLQLYHFVNQLGIYTRSLQSDLERALKSTGLWPFYTAGATMWRNGIHAVTATGPMAGGGWKMRFWQAVTGGILALTSFWSLANYSYWGKWPWQDPKSKFLAIRVKPRDRHTALGRALWGNKQGDAYVSLNFFAPILSRGAAALGATNAYETHQLKGTAGQVMESAATGAVNSALHPVTNSPFTRAATVLATGKKPYITSLHPFDLLPGTAKTKPGLATLGERVKEAALGLNSFAESTAATAGVGVRAIWQEQRSFKDRLIRMVFDLALPRLIGNVTDQQRKRERLEATRGAR